jgi:hypothetical protein
MYVLSWFQKRKYRSEVIAEMMAICLLPDNRFQVFLTHYFPGAFTAIDEGYKNNQNTTELAIKISGAVIAAMIEGLDAERRDAVQQEVVEWTRIPNAIHDLQFSVETARDGFAGRVKWAVAYVAKLELNHNLDDYFWDYFCSEVFGALAGKSSEEREADRVKGIIENAFKV